MKTLILGFDAVEITYILSHRRKFKHLSNFWENGICAKYSAYVQKGYRDSFLSEMNWASIYTGYEPWRHGVAELSEDKKERNIPMMSSFENLKPFWRVLNDNELSVGLWSAICCINPIEINGYVISSKYDVIEDFSEKRVAQREIQVCEKDKKMLECLPGNPPPRVYPKMLSQQGYEFEALKKDSDLAWEAVEKYHFQESVQNFEEELDYYFTAMRNAQEKYPVDVMFFYSPTTDLIAHCCMCSDDNDVLIQAYQVLDEKVGALLESLQPDNVILMSDHGMMNFKDIVECSDETIRREAFGARDEVLWLKNRYIAFEAHNGALLFTAHALKGMFLAAGRDIKHTNLNEMRTLDIYPTILELCGCKVPDDRAGYVLDIFNRPCVNKQKLLQEKTIRYRKIAVIQSHDPNVTDIVLNEIYLRNRFSEITLVGDLRYEEIFRNNPRITTFVSFEDYKADDYEEIYCGYYNTVTGKMSHLRVK